MKSSLKEEKIPLYTASPYAHSITRAIALLRYVCYFVNARGAAGRFLFIRKPHAWA